MASCCSPDEDTPSVSPVVVDESRTLVVTTNVPADITYGGKTFSNVTYARFEKVPAQGTLKIKSLSNLYFDQDDMAIDFDDKLTLAIDVQLVKKPTIFVSQADALLGTLVPNDAENQATTGAKAEISVPYTTVISGSTDPFSITTYVPAETQLQPTEEGDKIAANVLGIRCFPQGVTFSEPVTVTMTIDNCSGFDIECVSADGSKVLPVTDLGNDKMEVKISDFSGDWINYLKAEVTQTSEGTEVFTGTSPMVEGNNTVTYNVKTGAVEQTTIGSPLITNFLKREYGTYAVIPRTANFTSDESGTYTWRVTQPYRDITLVSGSKTFIARVYDEPVFEIISTQPEEGHSGGSIN